MNRWYYSPLKSLGVYTENVKRFPTVADSESLERKLLMWWQGVPNIVDDIKEVIQAAKGSNNKIQLLSLMCRKPENNISAH